MQLGQPSVDIYGTAYKQGLTVVGDPNGAMLVDRPSQNLEADASVIFGREGPPNHLQRPRGHQAYRSLLLPPLPLQPSICTARSWG